MAHTTFTQTIYLDFAEGYLEGEASFGIDVHVGPRNRFGYLTDVSASTAKLRFFPLGNASLSRKQLVESLSEKEMLQIEDAATEFFLSDFIGEEGASYADEKRER